MNLTRLKNLFKGTQYPRQAFILALFAIAFLALVIINVIAYIQFYRLVKANFWVTHTYQVIQATNKTFLGLLDAETHQRGYLITNDIGFLKDLDKKIEAVNENIARAITLTVDNPSQRTKLNQMNTLVKQRISMLLEVIQLRKTQGSDTRKISKLVHEGELIMDQIKYLVGVTMDEEFGLLKKRNEAALIDTRIALEAMILASVLSMALFLIIFVLFDRQLRNIFIAQQDRKKFEIQLKGIIESTDMLAAIDSNYRYIIYNSAYEKEIKRNFGIDIHKNMSINDLPIRSAELKKEYISDWERSLAGEEFSSIKKMGNDGDNIYELTSNPIRDEKNKMIGVVHVLRNVTKRIDEENALNELNQKLTFETEELRERNEKITLLVEMSDVMQACKTKSEVIRAIGSYCEKLLNFSQGILYIMNPSNNYLEAKSSWGDVEIYEDTIKPDECWALRRALLYQMHDAKTGLLCDHIASNFDVANLAYVCMPLIAQNNIFGLLYLKMQPNDVPLAENRRLLIIAVAEAAALALANADLREILSSQSIHDSLTNLYNRRYLEEFLAKQLNQAKRQNIPMAIFMSDIDHFKMFNDSYGHEAGDILLKEIGTILQEDIRSGDIACRYGGEEFVLLFYNVTLEAALNRAEELRKAIGKTQIKYQNQSLGRITMSFGIALYPNDGSTPNELIEAADKALYEAKRSGRNKVVVYSEPRK